MLLEDWPHHIPLQKKIKVFAVLKSHKSSFLVAPNLSVKMETIDDSSAPEPGYPGEPSQAGLSDRGAPGMLNSRTFRCSVTSPTSRAMLR